MYPDEIDGLAPDLLYDWRLEVLSHVKIICGGYINILKVAIWFKYGSNVALDEPMSGIPRASIDLARLLGGEFEVSVYGRGSKREYITPDTPFHGIKCESEVDYIKKSSELLDEEEADIVHCMTHKYYFFLEKRDYRVIQHLQLQSIPLFWEHARDGFQAKPVYTAEEKKYLSSGLERVREWTRAPNEGVDAVIACSRFIQKNARIEAKLPIELIYNFVDLKEVGEPEYDKEDYILFAGALVPVKGVHTLLEAAEILEEQECETPVKVVGSSGIWDSEYDKKIEGKLEETGNIEYLGPKNHAETIKHMKKAAIGVIPSIFQDPSPFVAYEFQACGTPAIATNVGGIPEIIEDKKTGILIPPDKPGTLAKKIMQLKRDPAKRRKMGEEGRKRIQKKFTAEKTKPKYVRLYRRLSH